jgi:hydroxymethylbilane synthase
VEVVLLDSSGDRDRQPLTGRGLDGIFVDDVRAALAEGAVDAVVHSMKDVPCREVPQLVTAAVPRREDPRDELICAQPLRELPPGSVVGTCSVRRSAWITRVRPDLVVHPLRGAIDARIEQVTSGEVDAVVLAAAGLNRLEWPVPGRHRIPIRDLVPAPGQGALAVECRRQDHLTRRRLGALNHRPTHLATLAEREILARIDPTESTAVGALALVTAGELHVLADLSAPDGTQRRTVHRWVSLAGRSPSRCRDRALTLGAIVARSLVGNAALVRAS